MLSHCCYALMTASSFPFRMGALLLRRAWQAAPCIQQLPSGASHVYFRFPLWMQQSLWWREEKGCMVCAHFSSFCLPACSCISAETAPKDRRTNVAWALHFLVIYWPCRKQLFAFIWVVCKLTAFCSSPGLLSLNGWLSSHLFVMTGAAEMWTMCSVSMNAERNHLSLASKQVYLIHISSGEYGLFFFFNKPAELLHLLTMHVPGHRHL